MPPVATALAAPVPLELEPTTVPDGVRRRHGIVRLTVDIPSSHKIVAGARPPARWRTLEFAFYYLVAIVVLPAMVWIPYRLSSPDHPNYPMYRGRLSPGWLFGREVDNSDAQYRSFRSNIPALTVLVGAFFALKAFYLRSTRHAAPFPDATHRIPFLLTFALVMLFILHGFSALKVLLILSANYAVAKALGANRSAPLATWVLNGAVLYGNERYAGYSFASIAPGLAFMDRVNGVYPRWHVSFNVTMLRLLSFSMDHYWALRGAGERDNGAALTDKQRTTTPHPPSTYLFVNYLAYALYSPLYIAGPIMTFNDFMWQLRRPAPPTARSTASFAARFVMSMLTMEALLHALHVVAIKDARAWMGTSVAELCLVGFWNLMIVWLKLLLPWRFFRLWALADGIDPPENMVRCMANNYSTLGFWRSWHRSYNLWIVRYIYIPLGGTKHVAFTTLLVFSFVALWHDLSFKLLAWGWLVSLFILPELAARYVLPASTYADRPWYRHVCALGAVANILMMMAANLVGFVIGVDGMRYLFAQLVGSWEGLRFMLFASACLFVGAQLMFEYREEEMRRGIFRRC